MVSLEKIFSKFDIDDKFLYVHPFGNGHINETFIVTCESIIGKKTKKYILQKMNSKLFDVDKLMKNVSLVSSFVVKKFKAKKINPDKRTLRFYYTRSGFPYYYDKATDGYYRLFNYIENSVAYQKIDSPELFYQAALAFGEFASILSDFDSSKLYTILPDFHNTVKRYENFEKSLENDALNRASSVQKEIQFVKDRKKYASKIVDLIEKGKMPLKVTHNDTKLNNVLIDATTGKYLAVIDLDTIMPGSICYDFGDAIRFGCNTALEDEKNLEFVHFNIELFEAFTKGYLKSLAGSITKVEKENLAFGAILMTYECGMRFLADYLDGDVYFRTSREGQNLDRARTQFKLVEEMEEQYKQMVKIIKKY